MNSKSIKSIAIIGGGYTGLTAAYELSKYSNFEITLYEASPNLGGLAGGFSLLGTHLEKAYHHLFKTDKDIIQLIDELRLGAKLLWHKSNVAIYYDGKFYPFNSPMDLLRFKPLSFLSRLRLGIVLLYLKKKKNWQKFVNVSAYDWMGKWCGREAMKVIWEPLLLGKFSKYYKEISMAWLWARIHIRANSRARDGEKLGYITGGFDVLTEALQSKLLKQGVIIKKETRVQSIKRDDKTNEVILTFDNGEQRFDKVIVTLPSQVFAGLIGTASVSASYIKKLSSINYLGAVLLVFASDQKLSDYYWHNINDLGAPFLVFLNHTNLVPCSNYNGKYLYYLGTYVPHEHEYFRIGENDLTDIWFRYLKQMFPEFDQKKITEKHLFKFKFAQHVADLDYKNKIPDYRTPIAGVYLANFSQIFPEDRGTNYAVREGKKIAELLRSDLLGKSDLV